MNEPEHERSFDANKFQHRTEYTLYLWARTAEQIAVQGKQCTPQSPSRLPTRARTERAQQETFWWNAKTGQRSKPSTTKRVPVSLLRATGTKAADWTKRQSPEPRKRKVKGTSEGSGKMALQRVREILQSRGHETTLDNTTDTGLLEYLEHYHDA